AVLEERGLVLAGVDHGVCPFGTWWVPAGGRELGPGGGARGRAAAHSSALLRISGAARRRCWSGPGAAAVAGVRCAAQVRCSLRTAAHWAPARMRGVTGRPPGGRPRRAARRRGCAALRRGRTRARLGPGA